MMQIGQIYLQGIIMDMMSAAGDSEKSGKNGTVKGGKFVPKRARGHEIADLRHDPEAIAHAFESGRYPYKSKMRRAAYEQHKAELQVERSRFKNGSVKRVKKSSSSSKGGTQRAKAEQ